MISSIVGNNTAEMRVRLNKITNDFIEKNGELAVERIDGEEARLSTILAAVASLPFLAENKLVIVRSGSSNKEISEAVEQIISSITTSVNLIFYEPNIDKRTAYFKALKSKTDFHEYAQLDARSLPKWAVDYAKSNGGQLGLGDANFLVERVGANQQLVASELDKLITYQPQISRETVELLTEKTPQSKIFDLMDAAFAGNKTKALQLYEEQRSLRVEPQEIMAMLAWQLRLLVYAKLGEGKSADLIAKDIGGSAFPVTKAQSLVKKIDKSRLLDMVSEAESIDRKSKTSSIDLDEAIKSYIVSVL